MSHNFSKRITAIAVAALVSMPAFAGEDLLLETKQVAVTSLDLEAEIGRIPAEHRGEVLSSKSRIAKLLQNILVTKTLASQARKASLDHDVILRKQMESAADKVLSAAHMERTIAAASLPDFSDRAKELYKVNGEKYKVPAKVHASHILVALKGRTDGEALARIAKIRALAATGKPFDQLALEYSDDPSVKGNKGDLGFFDASHMVKAFSDAAFAMKTPLEVSEPVKTNFGYHVIQFIERQEFFLRSFEDVKPEIIKGLQESHIKELRQKLLSDIMEDPTMKLHEEAVNRYKTELEISPSAPAVK